LPREERYGTRDLTYSRWHRDIEPIDQCTLPYIDIDSVEYCHLCKKPLALVETAQDVGQAFKATTVLRNLAAKANLPAYLVFYRKDPAAGKIDRFRLRQVYPHFTPWRMLTPDEYVAFLRSLRTGHACEGGSAVGT